MNNDFKELTDIHEANRLIRVLYADYIFFFRCAYGFFLSTIILALAFLAASAMLNVSKGQL